MVSSLGAVPKQDSDEVRLIHDASMPKGQSINDKASPNDCHYFGFDTALNLVKAGSYMSKIDLKQGYRSVPIAPHCYDATGLKWRFKNSKQDVYFYDTRLPQGSSMAPGIFNTITQAIVRIMHKKGCKGITVYLDDFFISHDSYDGCVYYTDMLLDLLQKLGFSINWKKFCPPSQSIIYLGINIDSCRCIIYIPPKKLEELKQAVSGWIETKRSFSKRQLQSIIGKLSWAAALVRPARPLLRRLINVTKRLHRPSHHVRLDVATKADLFMWLHFLKSEQFIGVRYLRSRRAQPDLTLSTDSCTTGAAAWHCNENLPDEDRSDWFYINWEADFPNLKDKHINVKELFIVKLSVDRWGPLMQNKNIVLYTDNSSTKFWINKGTAKCVEVTDILRDINYACAVYDIYLVAKHIVSQKNVTADALSRLHDLDMATTAHAMIEQFCNIDIAAHDYALFNHMSYNAFLTVLQSWESNTRCCSKNCMLTEKLFLQNQQRPRTGVT